MIGQFPPPITGEGKVNEVVRDFLLIENTDVSVVDSCIIDTVNDVGKFTIVKFTRMIGFIFKSLVKTLSHDAVYMTPGQSLLGLLRFSPVLLFSMLLRKSIFIHWHGYGILPLFKKYNLLSKIYFNNTVTNILLTDDLLNKLKINNVNVTNTSVVNNFSEITPSFHYNDCDASIRPLKVMFLGGLMPEKGFDIYVSLAKQANEYEFHVCGSGNKNILDLVNELNVNKNVIYHGVVDGDKKIELLRDMDVFVLQTHYPTEGVPLTLLEAMACGCAIVTTRHNGIPETVGNAALFIEPKSLESLKDALYYLDYNRDKLLFLKQESLKQSSHYSVSKFKTRLLDVFSANSKA